MEKQPSYTDQEIEEIVAKVDFSRYSYSFSNLVSFACAILFINISTLSFSYAESDKSNGKQFFEDPIAFFKEFMSGRQKEIVKEAEDPNSPHKLPGIKYHFGSHYEISPVQKDVNIAGVTLRLRANEVTYVNLAKHPLFKGEIKEGITFQLRYPEFLGRTNEEIFNDSFRVRPSKQKYEWLRISLDRAKWPYEMDMTTKDISAKRIKDIDQLIKSYNGGDFSIWDTNRSIKASWWGYAKQNPRRLETNFRKPEIFPELSKTMQIKGLKFIGYGVDSSHKYKDNRPIELAIYLLGNQEDKHFEFITCGISDQIKEKWKNIFFKRFTSSHCYHYMIWKDRFDLRISYHGKLVKENWQKIRDKSLAYLDNLVVNTQKRPIMIFDRDTKEPITPEQIQNLLDILRSKHATTSKSN